MTHIDQTAPPQKYDREKSLSNLTTAFSHRLIENYLFFSAFISPLYKGSILANSQRASVLWAIQGKTIEK